MKQNLEFKNQNNKKIENDNEFIFCVEIPKENILNIKDNYYYLIKNNEKDRQKAFYMLDESVNHRLFDLMKNKSLVKDYASLSNDNLHTSQNITNQKKEFLVNNDLNYRNKCIKVVSMLIVICFLFLLLCGPDIFHFLNRKEIKKREF
ncbi:hypothetical protein EDEG_01414 [Edhazardia aedis USNM 41457]|uniref:Uncharacterized protein n=1 Tax=Edhazardia aedis (strain USNM 41457) TaxID=1003232 RepID=J9DSL2_EDHAE|nr:hypothetical protein EDEG_01414 [Edhazardia aedis USNM 41457]|eukprot:EJW04317.1 hypothetical protein EDEG_01414 [Edhazardia aedis USNM 41457]